MFCLLFTTAASRKKARVRRQPHTMPTRFEAIVTYALLLIWLLLMSFGAICYVNPRWLQDLSRPGINVEARDYKNLGDDQLRRGNHGLAVAQYVHSLKIKPDQPSVLVNLGIAYGRAGNAARGCQILKDALQMAGSRSRKGIIYCNLGELLGRQGKTDEAIHFYQQAVGFDVEQDLVYRSLGSFYLAAGRLDEAQTAFEMTLASQLDMTLPYQYMLYAAIEGHQDDATHLSIIEEQLARGVRAKDLARYDLEIVRRMQESNPEIAKTHNHLGFIRARLGNTAEAIRQFQRSLQIWPDNVDAKRNLQLLRR